MAFTKVVGAGIHTQSNIDSHNINSTGIITATKFDGPFDNIVIGGGGLDISGIVTATELDINGNGDISGNLVVGGNLTANGDFTTLNTTLREVELLRVDANDANLTAGIITQRNTGDILNLSNGSTELFTVVSDGNTGIGTNNPKVNLEVVGSGVSVFNSTKNAAVDISGAGKIELIRSDSVAYIDFKTSYGEDFDCRIQQYNNGLRFHTGGHGSTDERLRIDSDGKVGIGSQSPQAKLDVSVNSTSDGGIIHITQEGTGDAAIDFQLVGTREYSLGIDNSDDDKFKLSSTAGLDSDTLLTVTTAGKVGIGTVTPVRPLHIESSDCRIRLTDVGHATDVELQNVSGDAVLTTNGESNLRLQTNNGERLRITKDGEMLLGTGGTDRLIAAQKFNSASGWSGTLQIEKPNPNTLNNNVPIVAITAFNGANEQYTGGISFNRSNSNTQGTQGAVNTNQQLGNIAFNGSDGTNFIQGAEIFAIPDQNFATNDGPASLVFATTPDGTSEDEPQERLRITSGGNLKVPDDAKIELGGAQTGTGDLQIYHDPNNSHIKNTTGTLNIQSDSLRLTDANISHVYLKGTAGAATELYHDNLERLVTSSLGVTVTGEVEASQDYPNIKPRLNFNFTKEKKLDSRITYSRIGPASFTDEFGKVVLVGDNTPRLNYDPSTGEGKGLLIEQSRTNYVRNSLGLKSGWVAGSGSFAVDNSITNPDGSVGAYHHTGSELYHENIDLSGANTNTVIVSLWMKERSGQSGIMDIQIYQQITGSVVVLGAFSFDPATAVISTPGSNFSNGTVEEYPNGWYRVSAKVTTSSGNFTSSTRYDIQGAEHYVWGFQMEVGEFLTSFIPTNGDVGTRGADLVKVDGEEFTEFYNPVESTVVCEFDSSNWLTYNNNAYERIWSISNGSESDVIEMFKENTVNNAIRYRVRDGNANVLGAANISYDTNTTPKMAFALKLNDGAAAVDGTISGTTDNVIPMPTVDRLILGNDDNSSQNSLNGHIRKFSYYPVKLPDSQLVTLTS